MKYKLSVIFLFVLIALSSGQAHARWLQAQQGRFIQRDPIGAEGGINIYAYVSDMVLLYRDPLGLGPIDLTINEDFDRETVPCPGNPRGCVKPGDYKASVTCDCPDEGGGYSPSFDITYEISIYLLKEGHERWTTEQKSQYDKNPKWAKYGKHGERPADIERQATKSHEEDHLNTYKAFVDVANAAIAIAESKSFNKKIHCQQYATTVLHRITDARNHAKSHSRTYDGKWNSGGVYDEHPYEFDIDARTPKEKLEDERRKKRKKKKKN